MALSPTLTAASVAAAVAPAALAGSAASPAAVPNSPATAAAASSAPALPAAAPHPPTGGGAPAEERVALLRVRAEMVDRLVNSAGEVAIARGRIEGEMRTLKSALSELTENITRLRHQLREVEIQAETQIQSRMVQSDDKPFDPLEFDRFTRFQELTRMMAESVNDVATVHGNIHRALDETEAALSAQQRLSRDLQQDLLRVRMVPFASVNERLHRIVRLAAKETGKRAALDIRNGQVELDRSILERITAPFEHMLRNAIFHGLERPEDRRRAGKSETGEILIEVRAEGNQISLLVADDGRGLDLQRIRARAISGGQLGADEPADDARLAEMIFQSGFSTAEEVTQLAGRGVGMDIVRSEITAIGGRVEVRSETGRGTRFHITLPLTLVVTQAVLVSAGGAKYVIPSSMVEQVRQVRDNELQTLYREGTAMSMTGRSVPFYYLPRLLGDADAQPVDTRVATVLFVRGGSAGAALQVETVQGNQEIVVKNTGPMLSRITGITGATVLSSGEIILILNPLLLSQRTLTARADTPAPRMAPVELRAHPTVMVVDDSLTVRRATERLLTREGFTVITARDGVNALELLQKAVPAAMLVDIEMPRMDGFDLTRNVRADERLKDVPIIMITSRTAEKHRQVAFDLGVNAFLGKPYREDELLHHVRALVKAAETAVD